MIPLVCIYVSCMLITTLVMFTSEREAPFDRPLILILFIIFQPLVLIPCALLVICILTYKGVKRLIQSN